MRILSIDGGGVLGCGPAELLACQEYRAGGLNEQVLAGTSVGGLLVAMRCKGFRWTQINSLFNQYKDVIFAPAPLTWKLDPTRPRFPSKALIEVANDILGDMTCKDSQYPFFIPVYDFVNGKPKIYDNTDSDRLADVVVRTTAAPTYFAPPDNRWADGGLISNNPSAIAIAGVHAKLAVPLEKISVLSLNTGGTTWKDPKVSDRMTKLGWVAPLITSQLEGNEEVAEYISSALIGSRHLRLTPKLTQKPPIDDPSVCPAYRAAWASLWQDKVGEICEWRNA